MICMTLFYFSHSLRNDNATSGLPRIHILIGETAIRHNQHQNRLYLDADFQTDYVEDDYLIIECYRKLVPIDISRCLQHYVLEEVCNSTYQETVGCKPF